MISEIEILMRLLLAAGLGALVGFEREQHNQSAGLRTHIVLVLGSALAMTLSINLSIQFRSIAPNGDPARLAAQVISGIGFLGAGAILRMGTNIRGLTTATSLWTMAIVGLAAGAGHFIAAVGTTVLLLFVLFLLDRIEHSFIDPYRTVLITVNATDRQGIIGEIRTNLLKEKSKVDDIKFQKNLTSKQIKIECTVRIHFQQSNEHLADVLGALQGIHELKFE
jgi:putative Mg2+ transporter-C (MgtC) family protein